MEIVRARCRERGYPSIRGMKLDAATNPHIEGEPWDIEDFQPLKDMIAVAKPGDRYSVYLYKRSPWGDPWELEDVFTVQF